MIDRQQFAKVWLKLAKRFGVPFDEEQAGAYHEYLTEQGLSTEDFLRAARALWATSTFFPRPADFVSILASDQWLLVLSAVSKYTPPSGEWYEPWKQLTERSIGACKRLGGIQGMRTIYERDVIRLKTAWEQAYEQETARAALELPTGGERRALSA